MPNHALTLTLLGWALLTSALAWLFHAKSLESYMDEPFHVPQTQRYCRGDFATWDPKITTFPGLYIAGMAWAHLLHVGSQAVALVTGGQPATVDQACGTTALRSVNLLFSMACLALFYAMHRRLHADVDTGSALGTAVVLALFPLHFFFQFLYYTDVASVAFVTSAHLACLQRRYGLAALAAAAATGVRQTNAVWAAFTLGVRGRLARQLAPLAAVPAAFAAFVAANGDVVVGDRAAHAPARHLAQPLYFAAFAAAALAPAALHPDRWRETARQVAARPLVMAAALPAATAALAALIDRFTVVHPYLLADNRHYTFYVWKDLLGRSATARRALAPAYMAAGWWLWGLARARQSALWCAAWAVCTAAVLVPAALVEFRYFTTPFLLLALHMQPLTRRQLALTGAAYAAIDAATICAFLFWPFAWPDGSTARFMW